MFIVSPQSEQQKDKRVSSFLWYTGLLLLIQAGFFVVLLLLVHYFHPKRFVYFFGGWKDILIYLVLVIGCVSIVFGFNDYKSGIHLGWRTLGFFMLGGLLAYVMAIQYNIISFHSIDKKQTQRNLMIAVLLCIGIYGILVMALPFLLMNQALLMTFAPIMSIVLIGFTIWGFFITTNKGFYTWTLCLFLLFLVFLVIDLTRLVYQCRNATSEHEKGFFCDPPTGATLLWTDIVNMIQKLFFLLNWDNQ